MSKNVDKTQTVASNLCKVQVTCMVVAKECIQMLNLQLWHQLSTV